MTRVDGQSPGDRSLLRIVHADERPVQSDRPVSREQMLAETLQSRLNSQIDRIRIELVRSPMGAGQQLDVLA
jgi:hypothetical protein